jgi:NAD(P)H-dependent FMN reductase
VTRKTGASRESKALCDPKDRSLAGVQSPIGATGFVAEDLWQKVMSDFGTHVNEENLEPYYQDLGDKSLSNGNLVERVLKIVAKLASP